MARRPIPLSAKRKAPRGIVSRPRRSVRLGSDMPPACHSPPTRSIPHSAKRKAPQRGIVSRPRRSVRLGSDMPPACHSPPTCSIPLRQKEKPPVGGFSFLVDPRGIEPLSENLAAGPSPWAVCNLKFPLCGGHRQPPPAGSAFMHDRSNREPPIHVHHCMTPPLRPWSSARRRAA